ncbi:agrin-like isoform X2 [Brachionus plicatilis]|uniref:Agrin-like isoform X2 n=1 Tax=Brachionus plicatilis TaxID=10195 RepID=A0A3M7T6I2_BRAPC|nr:agrin-like isoform X2 [Brachionus plicatilis]
MVLESILSLNLKLIFNSFLLYNFIRSTMNPCVDHKCNFGGQCEIVNGVPLCKCIECSEAYKPVCGSDGVTYNNICKLRYESCNKQTFIEMSYEGVCDRCKSVNCPYYGTCVDDDPVCGTDGITHANECHLKLTACITKIGITVAYRGPCDQNHDLTIYSKNVVRNCEECGFNSECFHFKKNNTYKCLCTNFDCSNLKRNLVCGSNGILYENKCQLERDECLKQAAIAERPVTECSTPCKGFQPLINLHTNQDYFCKNKNDCPADSHCDMRHSKCCLIKTSYPIERSMICHKDSDCIGEGMLCHLKKCVKNCTNTEYGCCDDGRTPAKGPTKEDCPKVCNCHPAGSYNQFCDPVTGNCPCRPGVLGKHCDSCSIGYWGIKKILDSNTIGCLPCSCNKFGSLREDCNQENGQCQCKKGVYGLKCNECPSGSELNSEGCISIIKQKENLENLCSNVICNYPGSYCSVENGIPKCVCNSINCESDEIEVCGQDGQTYASKCDLMRLSCNRQIPIEIAYYGKCTQANLIDALAKHNPWHKESRRHRTNSINKTINQQYYNNNGRMQNSHENSSNLYDRKSQRDDQLFRAKISGKKRILTPARFNTYQDSSLGHNIYDHHEKLIPYGTKKCKKDYNCGRNMECIENICYCIDDFIPENEHCIDSKALIPSNQGHNQKRFAFNPCKSKPCFAGKIRYNSVLFPSFRPKSFLELNPVEINLNDFVLDLEFKPSQLDESIRVEMVLN